MGVEVFRGEIHVYFFFPLTSRLKNLQVFFSPFTIGNPCSAALRRGNMDFTNPQVYVYS